MAMDVWDRIEGREIDLQCMRDDIESVAGLPGGGEPRWARFGGRIPPRRQAAILPHVRRVWNILGRRWGGRG